MQQASERDEVAELDRVMTRLALTEEDHLQKVWYYESSAHEAFLLDSSGMLRGGGDATEVSRQAGTARCGCRSALR
jgi:hypothetical protein